MEINRTIERPKVCIARIGVVVRLTETTARCDVAIDDPDMRATRSAAVAVTPVPPSLQRSSSLR